MTLLELLDLMKKRIKLVIGLPIVCALLIGVYSFMFMPDTYTATTSMYVLTNQEQSAGNLSTDLSASQMVANDVTTLLNSNRVSRCELSARLRVCGVFCLGEGYHRVNEERRSQCARLSMWRRIFLTSGGV